MNRNNILRRVRDYGDDSSTDKKPYICCWDDCQRLGTTLHPVIVREGKEKTIYIFCSERHRQYHINSHIAYGRLPPGYQANY